ncbi:hypothetical protein [cf. Phormidesmis sp. LEGE 11477]|uniref:hypothetical protein n=1 Tax=cf. Phormidesmis sp. LEGE 11477 TaxID=1828680 RepID=UPI0018804732|nr:hypothetical protein [cf. Phormidesmis sp. LEGE 11477]MBE9064043.1 hypothetical protein [cf. Phormidesmis sp. LEGE 11477]
MVTLAVGETYKYLGEEYTFIGEFAGKEGNNSLVVVHLASNPEPKQPFLALSLDPTGPQVFRVEGDRWEATSLPPIEDEPPAWAIAAELFPKYGPVA